MKMDMYNSLDQSIYYHIVRHVDNHDYKIFKTLNLHLPSDQRNESFVKYKKGEAEKFKQKIQGTPHIYDKAHALSNHLDEHDKKIGAYFNQIKSCSNLTEADRIGDQLRVVHDNSIKALNAEVRYVVDDFETQLAGITPDYPNSDW